MASGRETATCEQCHLIFQRSVGQDWRTRCFTCWWGSLPPDLKAAYRKKWNQADRSEPDAGPAPQRSSKIEQELADNLKLLIQLCHPDRHNASAAANKATAWLLDLKERLKK